MKRTQWIGLGVFALLAAALPPLLGAGLLTVYVNTALAAIVATGVALLMGFAGQVSLGQGAFFALGALTSALAAVSGVPHLLALVIGPLIAGIFGLLVGIPMLRLRGHYLAFGTLALQIIVVTVANKVDWFGGPGGIQGIPLLSVFGLTISTPLGYAYLALSLLLLVIIASQFVINSRFGRGLRALSGSESAAESAGVPVSRYKVAIFTMSAVFAGLAGALYPFAIGFVSAGSFSIMMSIQYVVMAVVGGMTAIWGGVAGAVLLTLILQALNAIGTAPGMPPTAPVIMNYAVYAVLLILALLFLPRGVLPTIQSAWTRSRGKRRRFGQEPDESHAPLGATLEARS